jgi:hypothetical protein
MSTSWPAGSGRRCRLLRPDARRSHVASSGGKLSPSAELMVDPGCGARCAIRDTGRAEKTVNIGPLPCSARLTQWRRGALGSLRRHDRGQRAGRVAAHPLTLYLFCRRIETQCPILGEERWRMERNTSTPLPPWLGRTPVRSAKPGSILRARRSMRCHLGKLGRPSLGFSGPCISSHRTRVRKASQ